MFDIEYDRSGNSNSSFYVRANILNLLFLYDFFIFCHVQYMLRLDKAKYLSLLFKPILSVRLNNNLWGSDTLIFLEFINIVSTF